MIRHSCHNRPCINPFHLSTGTNKDNSEDMVKAGRQTKGSNCHTAVVTEEQVLEIRQLTGSHASIGRTYGVSENVIRNIRSWQTWKWLK